jgi:uncharacterized protein (TIGR00730 family)
MANLNTLPIKRVCVYCASSNQIDKVYFDAAETLAVELVKHGVTVVYGGGANGLMGRLATTALAIGGHVVGIMPHFMREVEWAHKQVTEFHFVGDMHERKKKFLENVDALVALPGGVGTLEELLEAITLKKLGLFTKPIIVVNTNNYYEPLLRMLDRTVEEGFMGERHRAMWSVVTDAKDVIAAIQNAPRWDEDAIRFAALT